MFLFAFITQSWVEERGIRVSQPCLLPWWILRMSPLAGVKLASDITRRFVGSLITDDLVRQSVYTAPVMPEPWPQWQSTQ